VMQPITNFEDVCDKFGMQELPDLSRECTRESFFACDYAAGNIPYAEKIEMSAESNNQSDEAIFDQAAIKDFDAGYNCFASTSENNETLRKADACWSRSTQRLGLRIDALAEALGIYLQNNVFTKKKANTRGQSIHLPGFIRHLATKGNEQKIFSSKTAGGKPEYAIAILLDISASMSHGKKQACALETVFLMINALQQMNIYDFAVVLFGENVYPIKMPHLVWDSACTAALISMACQSQEKSTMDADAILFASRLLGGVACQRTQESVCGDRWIWQFWDQAGRCPEQTE